MFAPLICHVLIGPPGCGKSTFATQLIQLEPTAKIVSTDQIRRELFGDESIQGDWSSVEENVLAQIRAAIQAGRPIIYDATNAKKEWRMSLLRQLADVSVAGRSPNVQWIGWHLQTPLETCKAWNQKRQRQVPVLVIEELFQALHAQPPLAGEGFLAVNPVNVAADGFHLKQIEDQLIQSCLQL
jgi:predicted kinase